MQPGNILTVIRRHFLIIFGFLPLHLLLQATPSEMADFMIGCTVGNFRPSSTCEAVCRLLQNRSSCCYGVNYDSRAVCACCNLTNKGKCPTVCSGNCHIITVNAGNCSELRGTKNRSGGGPSIINDLSILSDHPGDTSTSSVRNTLHQAPRIDLESDPASENIDAASKKNVTSGSTKNKGSMSSTTNKLFQRLSNTFDLLN